MVVFVDQLVRVQKENKNMEEQRHPLYFHKFRFGEEEKNFFKNDDILDFALY